MTFFYPLTHRQWLKNKENGLTNYVSHEVTRAVRRINRHLTFLHKNHNTFLTDSDIVNTTVKRHVYKNAMLLKTLFLVLFIFLVLAESAINYENMEIFIMPGESGIRALLMRVVTAFIITAGSILFMHFIFENIFHSWLEGDKVKYNFPDTINVSLGDKLGGHDQKNRLIFLIICIGVMIACLWAIYSFAEKRSAIIEAIAGQSKARSEAGLSPLTLVSLLLPFIGGITMFIIKRNHNIVAAYKAMVRYQIRQDLDKRKKNYLLDVFSTRRAKTLNEEVSITFRRINKFKNYLEAINHDIRTKKRNREPYQILALPHTNDQNSLKKYIITRLEPETLRLANEINYQTMAG